MGKPSIFSREYEKRMKRRKQRIVVVGIVFLGFLLVIGMSFFTNYNIKNSWNQNFSKITGSINGLANKKTTDKKAIDKKDITTEKVEAPVAKKIETVQENIVQNEYALKLENGQEIKMVYEGKGEEARFKNITPIESGIFYDISPSGKAMVVFDDKAQSAWNIDIGGNQTNVAPSEYVSSGGTVYSKEAELKRDSTYIWCDSPKFIDEENIAYFSQLPWFDKRNDKYVWIVNSKTKVHKYIQSLSGTNMKFENVTEKGLKIVIDDKVTYLKNTGEIQE